MKFSRKIRLIEQLLDRVMEATDDENIDEISEELLEMKKMEIAELVEMTTGENVDGCLINMCWVAYLAGEQ